MKKSFFSSVAGATILISILGVAAKGFGFLREIIYAGFFGLKSDFESFLVGYVLPITINTAIVYLGQNFFIPEYSKVKISEPEKVNVFLNRNIWLFSFVGIIIAFLLFVFSEFIIENYLHNALPGTRALTLNIFRLLILTIPLNSAYALVSAYLQAEFRFTPPAIAQLFMNIIVIAFVFFFTKVWGIYSIPAGILIGYAVQLFYVLWVIRPELIINPVKIYKNSVISSGIEKSLLFIIFIEVTNQLYIVVDRYFINSVDKGGIAALNYAITIYVLPLSIFSFALSSAVFPKVAQLFNSGNMEELNRQYLKALKINSFLFIPVAVSLVFWGDVFIRIFYQRGSFSASDTVLTASLLRIFAYSLIFYSGYSIINKLIFTTGLVGKLLQISAFTLILKILLNFWLCGQFKQDGLAYSSSICYFFISAAGYVIVMKRLNFGFSGELFGGIFINLLLTLLAAAISFGAQKLIFPGLIWGKFIILALFGILFTAGSVIIRSDEIGVFKGIFYDLAGKKKRK